MGCPIANSMNSIEKLFPNTHFSRLGQQCRGDSLVLHVKSDYIHDIIIGTEYKIARK